MRMPRLALAILCTLFALPTSGSSEESYIEFAQGLRAKGYYDAAGWYFDQLEARKNLPQEIRTVLPFERALTLLQGARVLRSPAAQADQLDQAQRYLQQFIKQAGKQHPLFARANSEQAQILLGKARVAVLLSQEAGSDTNRAQFQEEARGLIAKARAIYKTAFDAHKLLLEKFPTYIDQQQEREQFAARDDEQDAVIRTQIDLARCTYEEARTYDADDPKFKSGLSAAADQFEEVYVEHRRSVAGLYAQLWQGKCFEEHGGKDGIGKAIGLYKQLLDHEGDNADLQTLQRKAKLFRLICLNKPERKDYALVVKEADEWMKQNRSYGQTDVGLGVRWELIQALVKRADDRSLDEKDRRAILIRAQKECALLNKFAGRYRNVSGQMLAEIRFQLNDGKEDPKDFDTARIAARGGMDTMGKFETALSDARKARKPAKEITALQDELDAHYNETIRMLRLALALAGPESAITDLNEVRYRLAYMYYKVKRSYEAAILGRFVGHHYKDDEENRQVALDSAYIAMVSFIQAYNASPQDQRDADLNSMAEVSEFIVTNWPKSDRAMDALLNMGQIYRQLGKPAQAAEWYNKIPAGVDQYASGQIDAGQAYWAAYQASFTLPDEEKPDPEQLTKWRAQAEQHLSSGVQALGKSPEASGKAKLIAARVSLAQILNSSGRFQDTLKTLTEEPFAALQAIQVKDERNRPQPPSIQSRNFASLVLRLMVRAYIGIQEYEKARSTMQTLEKTAGAKNEDAVIAVYVQLGRALEKELQDLKATGENERLIQVRKSFETFLNDLADKETQTYTSLIWVGETYFGLASSSDDDPLLAGEFYDKAGAAYDTILERAAEDAGFVDEARLTGVRLRVAACRRRAGDFEQAIEIISEILRKSPKALDAQIEAATIYQDWGVGGEADDYKKLLSAMNGAKLEGGKVDVWGWGKIALRLQLIQDSANARADYETRMYDARHNSIECRLEYAVAQGTESIRKSELDKAEQELLAFSLVSGKVPDEQWKRFDALYQEIRREAGKESKPLEKPKDFTPIAKKANGDRESKGTIETPGPGPGPAPKQAEGPNLFLVLGLVVVLGGGAVLAVFMMSKRDSKRRVAYDHASVPIEFPVAAGASPERSSAAGQKPRRKRPAEGGQRPRQKPPKPE